MFKRRRAGGDGDNRFCCKAFAGRIRRRDFNRGRKLFGWVAGISAIYAAAGVEGPAHQQPETIDDKVKEVAAAVVPESASLAEPVDTEAQADELVDAVVRIDDGGES